MKFIGSKSRFHEVDRLQRNKDIDIQDCFQEIRLIGQSR